MPFLSFINFSESDNLYISDFILNGQIHINYHGLVHDHVHTIEPAAIDVCMLLLRYCCCLIHFLLISFLAFYVLLIS